LPLQLRTVWRKTRRYSPAVSLGLTHERQFVFVDIAERNDARQHECVSLQLIEKDFPRHPSGAPGRQIERRLRQAFRMRAGLKAIDQSAIDQRGDDGPQEWRRYWNDENTHGHPD